MFISITNKNKDVKSHDHLFLRDCSLEGITYTSVDNVKQKKITARESELFFHIAYLFCKKKKESLVILRDDFAAHLNCTVRTVSRAISNLKATGAICVKRETIVNEDETFRTFNRFEIDWLQAFKVFGHSICGKVFSKLRDYIVSKLYHVYSLCGTSCPPSLHNSLREYIILKNKGLYKGYITIKDKLFPSKESTAMNNMPLKEPKLNGQGHSDVSSGKSPLSNSIAVCVEPQVNAIKTYDGTYIDQEKELLTGVVPHQWGELARGMGLKDECVEEVFDDFIFYWLNQGKIKKAKKRDWLATWRNSIRHILDSSFHDEKKVYPDFYIHYGEKKIQEIWEAECQRQGRMFEFKELCYFIRRHDGEFRMKQSYKGWEGRVKSWIEKKKAWEKEKEKVYIDPKDTFVEGRLYKDHCKHLIIKTLESHLGYGKGEACYKSWFAACDIEDKDGELHVKTPNVFVKQYIQNQFRNIVDVLNMKLI